MDFVLPTASKERLEELLVYLGDRADDFKKCFDIDSEWCWKYADLMLRGLQTRSLEYGEQHHIVPFCWYKVNGCKANRLSMEVCDHNVTILMFSEHILAHYCAAMCGINEMRDKNAVAFWHMYNVKQRNTHTLPDLDELYDVISTADAIRVRSMIDKIARLDAEGRTHRWEDPKQAYKDYRAAYKEAIKLRVQRHYAEHKDEILAYQKDYYMNNSDKVKARNKTYRANNSDKVAAYQHDHYIQNKADKQEYDKEYRRKNNKRIKARSAKYRKENAPKIAEKKHTYYVENKPMIAEKAKQHRIETREETSRKKKEIYNQKIADGYRYRKDPNTGKHTWLYVGLKKTNNGVVKHPVNQFAMDGITLIATYNTIKDAAISVGVKAPCISAVCRGIKKTCKGYIFRYV